MSTIQNAWTVDVRDAECIVKACPDLPGGGFRSVSYGNNCLNVINEEGKLFTSKIKDGNIGDRKQPPEFSEFRLVQVESGLSHHVAITTNNQLVSWGMNDSGQLGGGDLSTKKGKKKNVVFSARIIPFFNEKKVQMVSCGNAHTLCLSEGRVYSWGANDCRQLGAGNNSSLYCSKPRLVESLLAINIAQISAGGRHSFALTPTGEIFRWGSNRYGQLGFENDPHRAFTDYQIEWQSSLVEKGRSIRCGEYHTAFLTMDGRVYTCGLGSSGQLGYHPGTESQFVPRETEDLHGTRVSGIECGRDYTVAYVQSTNTLHYFGAQGNNQTNLPHKLKDPNLRCGKDFVFIYKQATQADNKNSSICDSELLTLDQVLEMMRNAGNNSVARINEYLSKALGQAECVNGSFQVKNTDHEIYESSHGIDLDVADEFFTEVRKPCHYDTAEKALISMLQSLPQDVSSIRSLRIFLLLPCCLFNGNSSVNPEGIAAALSICIIGLRDHPRDVLGKWLKRISVHYFKRCVSFFKRCTEICIKRLHEHFYTCISDLGIFRVILESSITVLDMLNEVNKCRIKPISYENFYINDSIDKINLKNDFDARSADVRAQKQSTWRFCKYPFLFDSASKTILLKLQCQTMMTSKQKITVRRSHLVNDTRNHLSQKKKDLRKKLDIIFCDEIDYCGNGIRQEFFQIVIKQLLQEDSGAFYYEEESNAQWFKVIRKGSSNLEEIRFIGIICGLALYNGVTIHLQFPSVLYKKLLHKPVVFGDLFDLKPIEYRSLKSLLEYHYDDIEDLMCLDFATPVELCPNGADIPVNQSNKKEYVDKVTDYYLNTSVKKEFDSFYDGFYTAMPKELLGSFQPKELQEVLVGNEKYDFKSLEKITKYQDGYHSDHPTIRLFWEVFHGLELQHQKDFLTFLTGTYRIPAYGMSRLGIIIFPRYSECPNDMFPKAWTCTNSLMLPCYTNKESLKTKLLDAVTMSSGFGRMGDQG